MAKQTAKKDNRTFVEVLLKDVIISFPYLQKPDDEGRYRLAMLIDKDADEEKNGLKALRQAIVKVKKATWGPDKAEWPKMLPTIKDGDKSKDLAGYPGSYVVTASRSAKAVEKMGPPPIFDSSKDDFAGVVRPGMYANVYVSVFNFEAKGKIGVTCSIDGVQIRNKKAADIGGGKDVRSKFEVEDDEDEMAEIDENDQDDIDEDDEPSPKKSGKKLPPKKPAKKGKPAPADEDEDYDDDSADSDDGDDEDDE